MVQDTEAVRDMEVVQDMGDMITTVAIMERSRRRKRTKVQVLTTTATQSVILETTHIPNQQ